MRALFCVVMLAMLGASLPLRAQREKLSWDDRIYVEKTWPKAIKTSTGLRYLILTPGTGDASPRPGDMVKVLFQGRLLNGKVFNACLDPAHPFEVRLGRDQLIAAWEEALKQMKRGEKRLIIVPYELAYGTRGDPPRVPRSATLVFEIELVDFTRG
jgi:FKBP-type peptidyl-prolyl cis-trans isomerase